MALKVMGLLAKKVGMTTLFGKDGKASAVTILEVPDNYVVQVKNLEKDGYFAVVVGIEPVREKLVSKPLLGHFKAHNVKPLKYLKEFRLTSNAPYTSGQVLGASLLKDTKFVDVTGITKGRGFTGMVKRWNKKRGPESHGSMNVRAIGSVGSNTFPGRIRKGKKMPGHYGNEQVTIKNLEVFDVDEKNNIIIVKGAVPGYNGGIVVVKPSYKSLASKKEQVLEGVKK